MLPPRGGLVQSDSVTASLAGGAAAAAGRHRARRATRRAGARPAPMGDKWPLRRCLGDVSARRSAGTGTIVRWRHPSLGLRAKYFSAARGGRRARVQSAHPSSVQRRIGRVPLFPGPCSVLHTCQSAGAAPPSGSCGCSGPRSAALRRRRLWRGVPGIGSLARPCRRGRSMTQRL